MSDLVGRLEDRLSSLDRELYGDEARLLADAIDRIEALTEAAQTALHVPSTGDGAAAEAMRIILRRALEAK